MNNGSSSSDSRYPPEEANLRQRRERLGLTRPQLAVQARCSITTIKDIEAGVTRRGTTKDKIHLILTALEQHKEAA